MTEKTYGRNTSENVGISSENIGENPMHRKSKVSHGRFVRVGLVGAKARLKGVVDGQQVDIPVPLMHDKDTKEGRKRLC